MIGRSRNCLVLLIIVLGMIDFGLITARTVSAESGQAFSISPPLVTLKADPGNTVTARIKLTNISAGDLLIKSDINDFGAKNETGEPNIIFGDSNTPYSLHNWITSPPPFTLGAQQSKTIDFPILVPKNAEPGGHYAVIRFTGTTPEQAVNGVALSASIGSLVLLNVSGNVRQDATLTDFFSASFDPKANSAVDQPDRQTFFQFGPVDFVQRITNNGNVHILPTGTITIYDAFGRRVDSLRVNGDPTNDHDQPKNILPQSIRRFTETWRPLLAFGPYTAKMQLTYGGNKTLVGNVTFWVIPYMLIIVSAATGVATFFGLRFLVRRYNARIIKKARQNKL